AHPEVKSPEPGRFHRVDGRFAVPHYPQIRQLIDTRARGQLVNLEDRLHSRSAGIRVDQRAKLALDVAEQRVVFPTWCNDALGLAAAQVHTQKAVPIRRQLKYLVPTPIDTRAGAEAVAQLSHCGFRGYSLQQRVQHAPATR